MGCTSSNLCPFKDPKLFTYKINEALTDEECKKRLPYVIFPIESYQYINSMTPNKKNHIDPSSFPLRMVVYYHIKNQEHILEQDLNLTVNYEHGNIYAKYTLKHNKESYSFSYKFMVYITDDEVEKVSNAVQEKIKNLNNISRITFSKIDISKYIDASIEKYDFFNPVKIQNNNNNYMQKYRYDLVEGEQIKKTAQEKYNEIVDVFNNVFSNDRIVGGQKQLPTNRYILLKNASTGLTSSKTCLTNLTVKKLKEKAKERGDIKGYSKMNKEDLVSALKTKKCKIKKTK